MPHIPRSIDPSGLTSPDMVPRAPKKATGSPKPATPYRGDAKPVTESKKNPLMGDKLSMKAWDVDPMKIIRHLINREFTVDEHSGMVS